MVFAVNPTSNQTYDAFLEVARKGGIDVTPLSSPVAGRPETTTSADAQSPSQSSLPLTTAGSLLQSPPLSTAFDGQAVTITSVITGPSDGPAGLTPSFSPDRHRSVATKVAIGSVVAAVVTPILGAIILARRLRSRRAARVVSANDISLESANKSESTPRPYTIFPTDLAAAAGTTTHTTYRKKQSASHRGSFTMKPSEIIAPNALPVEDSTFGALELSTAPGASLASGSRSVISTERDVPTEAIQIVHEDSGLRLQSPLVLDLPPKYTLD